MNKRRIASILLSVCMLMGLILPAAAADTPKITVGEARVDQAQGNTVTVPVTIENNPGFSGIDLSISIPDGWEIAKIAVKNGSDYSIFYEKDSYGDMERVVTPVTNTDADGVGKFVAAYGEGSFTEDGTLFWVTYTVPASAADGLYDVEVTPVKINTLEDTGVNIADDFIFTDSTGETPETDPEPEQPTKPANPSVSETEGEEEPIFDDIAGNWAEDYILECAGRGLVNGKSPTIFDPDANMTRAEFVMILWRAMGSPTAEKAATFTDLTRAWYLEPIAWAQETGVVNGTSPTTFDPEGNVTREQMMTILHRMAGSPMGMEIMWTSAYDSMLTDSTSISSWAKNAVYWSIYNDILCGEQSVKPGNSIVPQAPATRSQIAVSIIRYLDKY